MVNFLKDNFTEKWLRMLRNVDLVQQGVTVSGLEVAELLKQGVCD